MLPCYGITMVLVILNLRVKDDDYRRFYELKRRMMEKYGRYVTTWEMFKLMLDLLEKELDKINRVW